MLSRVNRQLSVFDGISDCAKYFAAKYFACRFLLNFELQDNLKCICNENFGFGIFVLSENFIFSDHFDTNLVENFELEDCEFLV